jgi:hypothetical protein
VLGTVLPGGSRFFGRDSVRHVLHGDVHVRADGSLRASGGHYIRSGDVRVVEQLGTDANGVVRARVQVRDPRTGGWADKPGLSHTFFPETWSQRQVVNEIEAAYQIRVEDPYVPGRWHGLSPSGVLIQGHRNHNGITSAWPVFGE